MPHSRCGECGVLKKIYGSITGSQTAGRISEVNQQIAIDEGQINEQKRKAMELSGRRQQLEVMRNNQRLRAQATNAATNQGAQFGSGLQGGLAQIEDQSFFNLQGINQNLEIGRNVFGINADISQKKQQLASLGGDLATDQAIGSLGGALMRMGPTIGGLSRDAGAYVSRNAGFNPGGPYV